MLPFLHLDPVFLTTAAIWPIAVPRNQALEPEFAGFPKQVRPDFALFEIARKDAVRSPSKQSRQISLAHRERKVAQIVAIHGQHI